MELEKQIKKQGRIKKQQKQKYGKGSAKLSAQVKRTQVSKGYQKKQKSSVCVKFAQK